MASDQPFENIINLRDVGKVVNNIHGLKYTDQPTIPQARDES